MARALVALVLYVLVVALTFGARTVVQRRHHGDTGWRFHRTSSTGAVAQALMVVGGGLLLAASLVALDAGAAHEPLGVSSLTRTGTALAGVSAGLGAALVAGGTTVTWVGQRQMGASWRIGVDASERTALVTDGLFRRVRNPIYTGMAVCFAGVALLVPNVVSAAALVTGWIGLELQVRRVEEPYLRAVHGSTYLAWASTSGRFIPGVGRLHQEIPPGQPPWRSAVRRRWGRGGGGPGGRRTGRGTGRRAGRR